MVERLCELVEGEGPEGLCKAGCCWGLYVLWLTKVGFVLSHLWINEIGGCGTDEVRGLS